MYRTVWNTPLGTKAFVNGREIPCPYKAVTFLGFGFVDSHKVDDARQPIIENGDVVSVRTRGFVWLKYPEHQNA